MASELAAGVSGSVTLVHHLTRHLRIACQPTRRDLEGAPLNTVFRDKVTCPACQGTWPQPREQVT